MIKKFIFYASIVILIIVNILVDININKYIEVLSSCFNKNILLNNFYYTLICVMIAFISILIIIVIKLVVFYKKEEIKGIKLKSEDRYISVQRIG